MQLFFSYIFSLATAAHDLFGTERDPLEISQAVACDNDSDQPPEDSLSESVRKMYLQPKRLPTAWQFGGLCHNICKACACTVATAVVPGRSYQHVTMLAASSASTENPTKIKVLHGFVRCIIFYFARASAWDFPERARCFETRLVVAPRPSANFQAEAGPE